MGYILDYQTIDNLNLNKHGEYIYDHLIMLSSRINVEKYYPILKKIIDFYDAGHNVFLAADIDADKPTRHLFTQFGVEID